jgi:hypothetical protein
MPASESREVAKRTIMLHAGNKNKCVVKSVVTGSICRNPRDNLACVYSGDTIIWQWNVANDVTFQITPKKGFKSPFDKSDDCTAKSGQVTCTVKTKGTKNTFFDYNIVVDANTPSCNLDPRLLIY